MSALEGVGLLALALVGVLLCFATANSVLDWWRSRELRRWPNRYDWMQLERVVYGDPVFVSEHTRERARVAFRQLRYKYMKRTR